MKFQGEKVKDMTKFQGAEGQRWKLWMVKSEADKGQCL